MHSNSGAACLPASIDVRFFALLLPTPPVLGFPLLPFWAKQCASFYEWSFWRGQARSINPHYTSPPAGTVVQTLPTLLQMPGSWVRCFLPLPHEYVRTHYSVRPSFSLVTNFLFRLLESFQPFLLSPHLETHKKPAVAGTWQWPRTKRG